MAILDERTVPYARNSASLLGAIRDFEITYGAYGDFQDRMENYWCLRWLIQAGVLAGSPEREATVVRDNVVKFRDLPFYQRVPSLPELASGTAVLVEVSAIDLITNTISVQFKSRVDVVPP